MKLWPLSRAHRRRAINLAVGVVAVGLTEAGRYLYRPFIQAHEINDWHLAGTMGNSFGTMATIFVALGVVGLDRHLDRTIILSGTIGVVLYELCQPLMGNPVDPWDVAATILFGAISSGLYRLLHGADVPDEARLASGPTA